MERVLPDKDIAARIADIAVGLATDCDRPERDVDKILSEHLKGAQMLPFVAFLGHDGKWVAGYSGFKGKDEFLKVLEQAENDPALQASDAVRKKLAVIVTRAGKAAEKGDWKTVMRTAKDAAKTTGRCPERTQLGEIVGKAKAWATGEFDAAIRLAQSGGSLEDARAKLMEVRKQFGGEPEADDADKGLKALQRLASIAKTEAGGGDGTASREKAFREFEGTRWTAIFEAAPAEAGGIEESGD